MWRDSFVQLKRPSSRESLGMRCSSYIERGRIEGPLLNSLFQFEQMSSPGLRHRRLGVALLSRRRSPVAQQPVQLQRLSFSEIPGIEGSSHNPSRYRTVVPFQFRAGTRLAQRAFRIRAPIPRRPVPPIRRSFRRPWASNSFARADTALSSVDKMMSAHTKMQPNQAMQLTSPDAAQSVLRPLCLLSGLAADCHVRLARSTQHDR